MGTRSRNASIALSMRDRGSDCGADCAHIGWRVFHAGGGEVRGFSVICEKGLVEIGDDLAAVLPKSRIGVLDEDRLAQWPFAQEDPIVVLVSANDESALDVHERVHRVRLRAPHASVFLVARGRQLAQGQLAALARAGVDDFFMITGPASRALLAGVIKHRLSVPPPVSAIRELAHLPVPAAIAPLVRWTIVNAYRRPSIEEAADAFNTTRRTIARRLERCEFPRYSQLRQLGSVLHILHLHTRHGLSMNRAARRVGLANASLVAKVRARWSAPTVEGAYSKWIWTLGRVYDARADRRRDQLRTIDAQQETIDT